MTVVGTLFSAASHIASIASTIGVPSTDVSFFASTDFSFFAVPLQALAAMFFATPVVLLFVYDKNNGVLEYLLSLGISQRDIYMQYLKAGLMLAGAIGVLDIILDVIAGTLFRAGGPVLIEIPILAIALDVSVVSLVTLIMMSFGSLQKQRVGSNQLLGTSVGALLVMPTFYIPLLLPSIAFWLDLGLACVIAGLSVVIFIASSRLIRREKLLP